MNKLNKNLLIVAVVFLIIGFVSGYFYKGYQIKKSLMDFAEDMGKAFGGGLEINNDSDNTIDSESKKANIANKEDITEYISNINVNVDIKEYESFLDSENRFNGKARSLYGSIKNKGDRNIKSAELLVKFLDNTGSPIYENDYNPLYNSDKWESIILKPNYSNEFSFNTDGVPSEWSGQIEYQISDLSFE